MELACGLQSDRSSFSHLKSHDCSWRDLPQLTSTIAVTWSSRRGEIGSFDLPPAPYLLPLAGAVLAAVAVLVFQNDLGMAALVVLGTYALVASVLSSKSSLASAGAILMLAAVVSLTVAPRVRDRVAAWLESWHDPAGRGFQFVQSEYVVAAGGIFGQSGPTLAGRVPEVQTDFILAGVATQWGWQGALAVLGLASIMVCRCVAAALHTTDGFRSLLALAIAALSGIQVLLICGGTLRVLPLTGSNLPLVSSGGTSMVATLFALGIVVRHRNVPNGPVGEPSEWYSIRALRRSRNDRPGFQPLPAIQKDAYTGDD